MKSEIPQLTSKQKNMYTELIEKSERLLEKATRANSTIDQKLNKVVSSLRRASANTYNATLKREIEQAMCDTILKKGILLKADSHKNDVTRQLKSYLKNIT